MINPLAKTLSALEAPARIVDVLLYETLTGHVDIQTDREGWSRDVAREHGDILVDFGAEILRVRVPEYTSDVSKAFQLLPPKMSFFLSYLPKTHPFFAGAAMQWGLVIRDDRLDPILAAHHDTLPAIAVCKAAVAWAMRKT